MLHLEATSSAPGDPILNISIFGAFVAITLFVVLRASRNNKFVARCARFFAWAGSCQKGLQTRHGGLQLVHRTGTGEADKTGRLRGTEITARRDGHMGAAHDFIRKIPAILDAHSRACG